MQAHKRLRALAKDPEMPRWCLAAIGVGFLIAGPFDELVIYPLVFGFVWLRRRELLRRHGFNGSHVIAALGTLIVTGAALGLGLEILIKMV